MLRLFAIYAILSGLALGVPGQVGAGADCQLNVTIVDGNHQPVSGALVVLKTPQATTVSTQTDDTGHAAFQHLTPATYSIAVSKKQYHPMEQTGIIVQAATPTVLEITILPNTRHEERVNVQAKTDTVDSSSSGTELPTASAKQLPSRPATVGDTLPLLPGIFRSPEGQLKISGTSEQRSALIVNSADVTDPATGQFGQTIPIDSVETLNVFQTPFLAEYGKFTSGLVSVETRRGSDKWKYELNDPFPDFRIRSYQLRGIRDATPRLNFEGPILANKLYFSEGLEYEIRKVATITLPFPNNQQRTAGFNSFSQFDYILSPSHLLTGTFHIAPYRQQFVNINYFNPEPVTPDSSTHDTTATIADRLTIHKRDLLENTLSYTRFTARTWGQGVSDFNMTPTGNTGSYFAQQQRAASRLGLLSTYSLHPFSSMGTQNLKFGSYIAGSTGEGEIDARPVNIFNAENQLLQRITFTDGAPVHKTDTELAFFGQDHWLISPRLALDIGLRTESQELSETFRFAPRTGIAWTPFAGTGTVLRAGIGVYYDRVPLNVYGFASYPRQIVTTYDTQGNILQGPILYWNTLGEVVGHVPFVFHKRIAGNFSPHSTNWSIQLEQPVTKFVKLRASYIQDTSSGLVIMNPIAPPPDHNIGSLMLTGDGQSRYHQFEITARVRMEGDKQQFFVSYVRSRARGDLNDFSDYLGTFPAPPIRPNQFGILPSDLPNRFLSWGVFHLPYKFQIAPIFEFRTGLPYTVTDASQAYVGTPNQFRYPDFLSVDSRVSKDFQINPKYSVRLSVSGFNLTRHFNPDSAFTNIAAPNYGLFFGQHGRRFTVDFDFLF